MTSGSHGKPYSHWGLPGINEVDGEVVQYILGLVPIAVDSIPAYIYSHADSYISSPGSDTPLLPDEEIVGTVVASDS
jgi:hypothetical protein